MSIIKCGGIPGGFGFIQMASYSPIFLADRHVLEAADLDVALLCGTSHEVSDTSAREMDETGPAVIGGRSQDGLPGFSLQSPRFANRMRRNLARPVLSNSRQRLVPSAGRPWPAPRHHPFVLWEQTRARRLPTLRGARVLQGLTVI